MWPDAFLQSRPIPEYETKPKSAFVHIRLARRNAWRVGNFRPMSRPTCPDSFTAGD
jgi:hypothetical protein